MMSELNGPQNAVERIADAPKSVEIREILMWYDGPLVFTSNDKVAGGHHLMTITAENVDGRDLYMAIPISEETAKYIESGQDPYCFNWHAKNLIKDYDRLPLVRLGLSDEEASVHFIRDIDMTTVWDIALSDEWHIEPLQKGYVVNLLEEATTASGKTLPEGTSVEITQKIGDRMFEVCVQDSDVNPSIRGEKIVIDGSKILLNMDFWKTSIQSGLSKGDYIP